MDTVGERLRWGVRQRLEFIDFRLFWEGRLNRSDVASTFGISPQQASADVGQYGEIAPNNVAYDRNEKAYRRTDHYEPAFIGDAVEPHLLQLVAVENGWMRRDETWFDAMPPVEVTGLRRRAMDPTVLLGILDAVNTRSAIDIEYGSLTGSVRPSRTIAPHALAYSAGRLYVRSWSAHHNDFRNYSLNRISAARGSRPSPVDPSLDFEWMHMKNLIILPNPDLPRERQAAVAWEHGMTDGRLVLPCRLSLSYYLMAEHNLEIEPGVLKPAKQQIVLENREEVIQARTMARQMSIEALERSLGSAAT